MWIKIKIFEVATWNREIIRVDRIYIYQNPIQIQSLKSKFKK